MSDTTDGFSRGTDAPVSARTDVQPGATPPPVAAGTTFAPLKQILPYIERYRVRAILALIALVIAALATLAVPVAVRRMIDFGFQDRAAELINSYFMVLIAVAAVLALASASRFISSPRCERIVADLRGELCASDDAVARFLRSLADHENCFPAHRRYDANQIRCGAAGLDRVAQSRAVRGAAMMVITEPAASRFRAVGHSGDRAAAGGPRPTSA